MKRQMHRRSTWLNVAAGALGACFATSAATYCVTGVQTEAVLPLDAVTVSGALDGQSTTYVPVGAGGSVTISQAIERAGGFREDAYPLGAMLLRRIPPLSVAPRGGMAYADLSAGALEALQIAMTGPFGGNTRKALVDVLRRERGLVRLPVAVDPAMRRRFPERDLPLQAGDVLYVPQRPGTVAVIGAVSAPGTVRFSTGRLVEDYLDEAGGLLDGARLEHAGVVLPSGQLRELALSPWKYQPQDIPPGSVVVVPYKNESLQRYARDAQATLALHTLQRRDEGNANVEGQVQALLPPLAEATMSCPAP